MRAFFRERPTASDSAVFLLGAGFMLVETKAITELGLVFGNTWQVIGVVILSILFFAFLANTLVQVLRLRRPGPAYLLLLSSLLLGWFVSQSGGLGSTGIARWATAAS